jgi:hypothetical protein
MKQYTKPQIVAVGSAKNAIRGLVKEPNNVFDPKPTIPAYQADE